VAKLSDSEPEAEGPAPRHSVPGDREGVGATGPIALAAGGLGALARKLVRVWIYRRDVRLLLGKDLGSGRLRCGRRCLDGGRLFTRASDLRQFSGLPPGRTKSLKRWSRERVAVAAMVANGRIVGMHALVCGSYYEPELGWRFDLGPGEWLEFAGWVAPEWRGRCVACELLNVSWDYMRERGATRVYTCVEENNLASLKLMFHTGHREVGQMLVVRRVLGWRLTRRVAYSGERRPGLNRWIARDRPAATLGGD